MPDQLSRRSLLWLPALAPGLKAAVSGSPLNVRSEGATGDGNTLDTGAIQAAIDKCAGAGGGSVLFPAGRYLTGTLRLRDRVTLVLDSGAVLAGSRELNDYTLLHDTIASYTSHYTERCLLRADNVTDVGITGHGTIDGSGAAFKGEYKVRPFLMRFVQCRGINISGVTIRDSPMWVQHYLACEDVLIDGIRVRSRRSGVNNDGIDIDSCRRVRIANCDIDAGDDAIVLKATAAAPCRDVVVTNCILSSMCNAFKLGTESNGGFDNIVLSNTAIYDTELAAIALEMVDGGALSRVNISNVTMRNVVCPLFFRLGNRARPISAGAARPGTGSFSGVTVRGVEATATSPIGCSIMGLAGHPVEDVLLEDVRMSVPGAGTEAQRTREIPEVAEAYPEHSMFGVLPAFGLYCRHVRGLSLNRVSLRAVEQDARPAFAADDVDDLEIAGLRSTGSLRSQPLIRVRDGRNVIITDTRGGASGQPLLALEGSRTAGVIVRTPDESDGAVLATAAVPRTSWRIVP